MHGFMSENNIPWKESKEKNAVGSTNHVTQHWLQPKLQTLSNFL